MWLQKKRNLERTIVTIENWMTKENESAGGIRKARRYLRESRDKRTKRSQTYWRTLERCTGRIWRWTKRHQFRIIGERSWKLRAKKSSEMMAFGWSRNENHSGMLRMGKKRIARLETIWEDGNKLEPWIFKRTDQDLGEILLRSSNVENDDEKHHHELLRYYGKKIRQVEPMMKRIWKILEKDIWLMTIHSYVKLRNRIWE